MKSALAFLAAGWFLFQALTIGDGRVATECNDYGCHAIGDAGAMAVYHLAPLVFVGLAILALAIVDWSKVLQGLRDLNQARKDMFWRSR